MHRALLPVLLTLAPAAHAAEDARCTVWARELAFGDALAGHDHAGFAAFLHPDAVFGTSSPAVTRGREAIAAEWKPLVDGTAVRLAWYPTHVAVNAAGDLAYSTGPALLERVGADPAPRLSSYQSVWQRDAAGQWHVLFDGGTAPRAATAAELAAFHAGRQRRCPPETPPSPR